MIPRIRHFATNRRTHYWHPLQVAAGWLMLATGLPGTGRHSLCARGQRGVAVAQDSAEIRGKVLPIAVYPLDYERLVDDQETVMRELVAFCGLDWDSRCLTFYETDRAVRTPTKLEVRKPIYRDVIGRWKRYEAHLQPLIEWLGGRRLAGE